MLKKRHISKDLTGQLSPLIVLQISFQFGVCVCVFFFPSQKCSIQIQEAENKFKVTTKTAQSLVKDSSQEAVTSMLKTLNMQKEVCEFTSESSLCKDLCTALK